MRFLKNLNLSRFLKTQGVEKGYRFLPVPEYLNFSFHITPEA